MDNTWLEEHDERLATAQHNVTRAVSSVWLSLLRERKITDITLAFLKDSVSILKTELDALLSDVESHALAQAGKTYEELMRAEIEEVNRKYQTKRDDQDQSEDS